MDSEYQKDFVEHSKSAKKNSRKKFYLNMQEVQSKKMEFIPLNPKTDTPLPLWAKRIVFESHLSKRTRLLLLQFHDKRIREYRFGISKQEQPQEEYKENETRRTGNAEAYAEEDDGDED